MSFNVPYSSSPPSTPDRKSSYGKNNIFSQSNNPSTTPAGPPPSSAGSFTPAGPPPSLFMGSSILGGVNPMKPLSFSQQSMFNPPQHDFNLGSSQFTDSMASSIAPPRSGLNREYKPSPPPQRSFQVPGSDEGDSVEYLEEGDEEYTSDHNRSSASRDENIMTDEDGPYDEEDEDMDDYQSGTQSGLKSIISPTDRSLSASTLRRSQGGEVLDLGESFSARNKTSMFGKIAKDMSSQMGNPDVDESDDLILSTEATISRLYEESIENSGEESLQSTLMEVSGDLTILWEECNKRTLQYCDKEYTASIGPDAGQTKFSKANFLGSLALQIYHPMPDQSFSDIKPKPLPQTLINWMHLCHNPYPSQTDEIQLHRPSPSNHRLFWETLFNELLRGRIAGVLHCLENGGWQYARAGLDDPRDTSGENGYSGQALVNVEKVVKAAAEIIKMCPGRRGNFDTRGSDWGLFRLKAGQALEDLKSFAEGRSQDRPGSSHRRSLKGNQSGTYSKIAQKAGSQVPWHIYQNLVTLYNLIIGDANTIVESAQDWCEATIGLLVWWDEGRDDRRVTLSRSHISYRASIVESDTALYLRKLKKAFEFATAENTDFQVNTLNPVEVGLASLFEGDAESVVGLLRSWSGPISAAVAEIATIGGWLPHAEPQSLMQMGSLDQDDLDLLGISDSSKIDGIKDQTLIAYAKSVSRRGQLESTGGIFGPKQKPREGWELAIAILGRLDSAARSMEMVGDFLMGFQLKSSTAVDKLWVILQGIGMTHHAENIAESYAERIADKSHNYGEAIWYYALAHKSKKVNDVLDLLISFSLVQSTAFPAKAELDDHLKRLVTSPKSTLQELSNMDMAAAEVLHKLMSGYATLRKFYDLRDEEVLAPQGQKSQTGARLRKAEAAKAILAVIRSSDDNIRGGLYDEGSDAVVNVDFLLVLLGEAMVFVNQPNTSITGAQIDILLKAIEDLQAVGPRVYTACSEFLQTVLASAPGLPGSTPSDMLRKSTSNLSGAGSFSMVGSSMLASQMKQSMGGSSVLVKGNIKRGWDWRSGFTANTSGEDVLRILRYGLAKDLAKAWLREADGVL